MAKLTWPIRQTVLLIAIGVFCGHMAMMYMQTLFDPEKIVGKTTLVTALRIGFYILGSTVLLELHKRIYKALHTTKLTAHTRQRFLKYHIFTYLIFLGFGFVLAGIKVNVAFVLLLLVVFVIAQLILLWFCADRIQKEQWFLSSDAIPVLFFISGFAALIYQVVWQRVLFTTFGSNIESVTVIVSVFMFGLGIGALAGGQVQKRFPNRLMECFIIIELLIGLFGIFSIPMIHWLGSAVPNNSLPKLIACTYALLAFPTMLMGSTLPILVGYLQKRFTTLSATVGKLYAYNTFGSALASFLTVMLVFTLIGQQATLMLAAACNAITAYLLWFLTRRSISTGSEHAFHEETSNNPPAFSYNLALLISLAIGFISLSLEILWIRILGFMSANMPQVFGTLLAVFLVGIAYGSLSAKRWSETGKDTRQFITNALLRMCAITYLSVPVTALVSTYAGKPIGAIVGYAATGGLAYYAGGIFPLLCQAGHTSKGAHAGVAVSRIYFVNIIGATLGSLITGFILLDKFTLSQNMVIASIAVLLLFLALLPSLSRKYLLLGAISLAAAFGFYPILYNDVITKLSGFMPEIHSKYINENRHGIINVLAAAPNDVIFGNGIYDGRFNTDPVNNSNIITRAYMVGALHPNPKRILEIGLSSGSWAKVFSSYEPLEKLVTIEINPGYLEVLKHYPQIASIIQNPKWSYHIDDGRRWLKNNPNEKFDMIVMNTTYYWRMNATNILSREMLELCKQHLNPGGVLYYNTTEARDNVFTAASVFKHIAMVVNLVAASDTPFNVPYEQKKKNLLSFLDDNSRPIFANLDQRYPALLEKLASDPLTDIRDTVLKEKNLWVITDDNMASEYKIDNAFLKP